MAATQNITLLSDSTSSVLSVGGGELPASRRYVDLSTANEARIQFQASNGMQVRVEYSTDGGATFGTLFPEDATFGSSPNFGRWMTIPPDAKTDSTLVRCIAIGTGLLVTIYFVELQYR